MDDAGNVVDGGAAAAAGAVATAAVVLLLHSVSVTLEPVRDNSEATQSEIDEAGHHACLAALESFDSLWAAWKADSYLKAAIALKSLARRRPGRTCRPATRRRSAQSLTGACTQLCAAHTLLASSQRQSGRIA